MHTLPQEDIPDFSALQMRVMSYVHLHFFLNSFVCECVCVYVCVCLHARACVLCATVCARM